MIVPQTFATLFARTLDLFRDPNAKEGQKVQFRGLVDQIKSDAVTVAIDGGRLSVNGTPLDGPAYAVLTQRLEFHSIGEIKIPAGPPPGEMFELLKALAEQPGESDVAARLKATGARQIAVTIQSAIAAPTPKMDLGTEGVVQGDMDMPQVAQRVAAPPPPPTPPADVPSILQGEDQHAFAPAQAAHRSTSDLVADLQRKPMGPQVPDLLAVLGRQLETAMRANKLEQALSIVAGIVRAEQSIGEEARRRQYSIALKRMYSKPLLEAIAHLVPMPSQRDNALLALQRAGEDGVEVLLDLLVAAPTIDERRGIFQALTGMKEGTDQLIHMLGHHQWFVVRNVAELVGELGLEDAVPALARQLDHEDERVRKAVALALAKTGSRSAAEPLRRALKDKSPEVRIQAAVGVGGRKAGALAMPLVVAMGEEENEAVEQELMLALGRIGSPDAVQALIKFAQPGGKLFGRKPTALRVTAVEALRLAGTPAAIGTLEGLGADSDKQVRAAAQAALRDLKHQ
ncbi:MAG TPA: HEAT repeat domain-containing protein [Gemmatimonadales bacterium]|jgi:HEAT repeat protein|nr:HEAT repeat domain-containing protein [Gemmatimonadales bacterium]